VIYAASRESTTLDYRCSAGRLRGGDLVGLEARLNADRRDRSVRCWWCLRSAASGVDDQTKGTRPAPRPSDPGWEGSADGRGV